MHTQTDTAKVILARRADYVMTVKANMPTQGFAKVGVTVSD
jgi:hypothetical protein